MSEKDWPNFSRKLISKVGKIIHSGKVNYVNGIYGLKFEKKFSQHIGNKYSIAICNGTAALEVAVKSLGLLKNSEIIVPARAFFLQQRCIVNCGYKPILCRCRYSHSKYIIK